MSVTIADFPASLAIEIDSATCGLEYEDVALKTPLEGGYAATRPKHTRIARRTFKFGFTEAKQETVVSQLDLFYRFTLSNGTLLFNFVTPWTRYTANVETVVVRFKSPPSMQYVGNGPSARWTITCEVEEV
jgi:hypothetical protein